MKKFEEEMKEWFGSPTGFNMEFQSGYEAYSALIKRFKDWVSPEDYEKYIKESTDNTSKLLGKINDLKSQLEKQQPEIPECVAEFIENYDDINETSLLYIMKDFVESKHWDVFCKIPDDLKKYGRWDDMLYKAIRFGYTVAKEKRFYLKNKLTGLYLAIDSSTYIEIEEKWLDAKRITSYKPFFTQQEIDSMETGSYEQIEVEE